MEKVCDIVGDLLPLYLDHVCSDESRRLVEEHIGERDNCGLLLERMQAGWPEETVPPQKGEEVLREAAWSISKWALGSAVGITAIVLYRLVYLWQDILAASGDYRNFSYGFHEVYTIGSLLVPVLTLIWLAVLLRRTAKNTPGGKTPPSPLCWLSCWPGRRDTCTSSPGWCIPPAGRR